MKEKIRQYLRGDLQGNALRAFEDDMSKNAALRAKVKQEERQLEHDINDGTNYLNELYEMMERAYEKAMRLKQK